MSRRPFLFYGSFLSMPGGIGPKSVLPGGSLVAHWWLLGGSLVVPWCFPVVGRTFVSIALARRARTDQGLEGMGRTRIFI